MAAGYDQIIIWNVGLLSGFPGSKQPDTLKVHPAAYL